MKNVVVADAIKVAYTRSDEASSVTTMANAQMRIVALSGVLCFLESFERMEAPGKIRSRENAHTTRKTLVCPRSSFET